MRNLRTHSERPSAADRWGLYVVAALTLGVCLVLFASIARAQAGNPERPGLPELQMVPCPDLEGIQVEEGVVRFPRVTSDCMLARLRLIPELVLYVELLDQRIARDDVRIGLRDREVALAERQAAVALGSLETALRRAREAEESRNAWYRSPVLWFVVGAVVTIVVVALTAYALKSASAAPL